MATNGISKVCVSGYFNPLHIGHISYINEAKKLGDYLIVIVDNDWQVHLKGSKRCMSDVDRAIILSNLKSVDEVFISIDEDKSVCESLRKIKPDIFANGGDRFLDNIPEVEVCNELGIKMVFNVGGEKIRSSSELIK